MSGPSIVAFYGWGTCRMLASAPAEACTDSSASSSRSFSNPCRSQHRERWITFQSGSPPNIDLHDLVERDAILAPVIELDGAGMRR
jgi:hypothetical protein